MKNREIHQLLETKGIDATTSLTILDRYNRGDLPPVPEVLPDFPGIDNNQVVDIENLPLLVMDHNQLRTLALGLPENHLDAWLAGQPDPLEFTPQRYHEFGILYLPLVTVGILNGGMATSYCDTTRNKSAHPGIFASLEQYFFSNAPELMNLPKGLAPAYYNNNGEPGLNFLTLRIRNALLLVKEHRKFLESLGISEMNDMELLPIFPFFHMTSTANNDQLEQGLAQAFKRPEIRILAKELGVRLEPWLTEIQPLLAAMTHKDDGKEKAIFTQAWGKHHTPLGLPGGHGQNFQTLEPIYRKLHSQGKKFAYLGNVDNLGSLPSPRAIAYLALSQGNAAFDFSFKTPVDTKGGILIRTSDGKLNCADIGPAISSESVLQAEKEGKPILFNCATGLFQLDYLVENLDRIKKNLPIRVSEQHKDGGKYSQAEQVTWEVIGLLHKPIILGVNKFKRFLAAKLLTDSLLTSGLLDEALLPSKEEVELTRNLTKGLEDLLQNQYAMVKKEGKWVAPELS